ncbi:50S ribosome-binding GTPase [Candidatus Microgenomates bacterium]|nr:50S ribosome-binding GTPase [Candidatus Microgenomates bacterium]
MDIQQRIAEIEKEIRETPYHKGTEHFIGKMRARIARLQDEIVERQSKAGGGGGPQFAIKKSGDATVVLVGPPSVGKSTLLNSLTNAQSRVAPYAFTTVTVIPGMMNYQGAAIQILDVPGIISGAAHGKGRGKEVLSVIRGADLLIFISEVDKEGEFVRMEQELYEAGVRINQSRPKIRIDKKMWGNITIHKGVKKTLDDETIREVAYEFGLRNAEITLKEPMDLAKLVDAFAKNRVYVEALYVVNKWDMNHVLSIKGVTADTYPISALFQEGLEELKEAIWHKLHFVRVYLAKDGQVDRDEALIMREGQNLIDVAQKIGQEFSQRVKGVKISGPGSKFAGQRVPLRTKIVEGMEITFVL